MSSEGVIKIKGDASEFIKSLDESQRKMVEVGKAAEKVHGHSKSFGEAWEHSNRHLERSLIHGLSLAHVMKEAAEAAKEFQDHAAEASKSYGGNALSRDVAARRLGIGAEKAEALLGGAGAASAEERTKFFGSLAGEFSGPGKRKLTEGQVAQAQSLFNSGLFSESEIKDAIKFGTLGKLSVGDRIAGLSETGYAEYQTRIRETEAKERAESLRASGGFGVRVADATIDARNAEHPIVGAFQSFVGKATSAVGGQAAITFGDRLLNQGKETNDLLRRSVESPEPPTVSPGVH